MKKIFKLNLIALITIFCFSFLFCGIIEINDQTSYISTGIKQDVIKAQSLNGKKVVSLKQGDNETFVSFNNDKFKNIIEFSKYCSVPPTGCVISILEKSFMQ